MHAMQQRLLDTSFPRLYRTKLETVQVNLGYRCNQSCIHCHVNAGPARTETMARDTVDRVIDFLRRSGASSLDLTGGAPEMNPHFKDLVKSARALGIKVIDRCNLTILEHPDHLDLADFLAAHEVEITASLPCYLEENVDRQRGRGVFEMSVRALARLNALGYGTEHSRLTLNLVYNPAGPSLAPPQTPLEVDYKRELAARFGIVFNHLYVLNNMPIQRFGSTLVSQGRFDEYMTLLKGAHRAENLATVMCRALISVDWQGHVYDCDFNQMLKLPLGGRRRHISQAHPDRLDAAPIATAAHCYGCTAGQGSSCGGALETRVSDTIPGGDQHA